MGPSCVGNSALVMNLFRNGNVFTQEYQPTLEDKYQIQMVADEKSYLLYVTDTSGAIEYSTITDYQVRNADVFSLDSEDSLESMNFYIEKVHILSDAPIILVENKCNLKQEHNNIMLNSMPFLYYFC